MAVASNLRHLHAEEGTAAPRPLADRGGMANGEDALHQPNLILQIDPDAATTALHLPSPSHARIEAVLHAVGGPTVRGAYHPTAVVHTNARGPLSGLPFNAVAWALASGWHGQALPYGLFGPVVVTTCADDGTIGPLPIDVMDEAARVAAIVSNVVSAHAAAGTDLDTILDDTFTATRRALLAPLS